MSLLAFYNPGLNTEIKREIRENLEALGIQTGLFDIPQEATKMRLAGLVLRNLLTRKPFVATKYYRPEMLKALCRIIEEDGIDIVWLDMLPLLEYVPHIRGKKIILTTHNVESERMRTWAEIERFPWTKGYLHLQAGRLAAYERKYLNRIDACVVVSENDREFLVSKTSVHRDKFHVIPNGVDTDYYTPSPLAKREKATLVWVGGMNNVYNRNAVENFLKGIFPIILARNPDVVFDVIGNCPESGLEWIHERFGESVRLLGFVDDIRPHLGKATAMVVPLQAGGGTKLKVLDGLAMGVPTVSTTIGAEGLAVRDGEHLLIADKPEDFSAKVESILRSPSLQDRLGQKARELAVKQYSWKVIQTDMEGLLAKFS